MEERCGSGDNVSARNYNHGAGVFLFPDLFSFLHSVCELVSCREQLHGYNRLRGGTGRRRRKASDFKFSPGGLLSEVSALVSRLPIFSPPAALSLSGYRAEGTFLDSEVLDWTARELIALAGVDIKLLTVHDTMNIALTPPEDLDRSVKDDLRKSAFIALGFDGPQLGGHFYLLVRMGPGTPLRVYESHPTVGGQHRRTTRAFRHLLGGIPVETFVLFPGRETECGLCVSMALALILADPGEDLPFATRSAFVDWVDARLVDPALASSPSPLFRWSGGSSKRSVSFSPVEYVVDIPARACSEYADGGFFTDPREEMENFYLAYMDMLRGGCTDPQGFFDEWSHLPVFDDDLVRRLRDTHWLLPHRGEVSRFAAELGVLLPGATRVHFSSSTEVFPVPARDSDDYADSGSYPDPYEQVFKFYAAYTTMLREGGSRAQEFFDNWKHLPIFDLETANSFPESHWVNEHRKRILSFAEDLGVQVSNCPCDTATVPVFSSRYRKKRCNLCKTHRCSCARIAHGFSLGRKTPKSTPTERMRRSSSRGTPRDLLRAMMGFLSVDVAADSAAVKLSVTGGGLSPKLLREAVLLHAPRMSDKDIAGALKEAAVGDAVVMTWRFSADLAGSLRTRTWVGEIIGKGGTKRSPSWRIRWETTPMGDLDDEDNERVAHPTSSLPAPFLNDGRENEWQVDVLAVHVVGPADCPRTTAVNDDPSVPPDGAILMCSPITDENGTPSTILEPDEGAECQRDEYDDTESSSSESSSTVSSEENLEPSEDSDDEPEEIAPICPVEVAFPDGTKNRTPRSNKDIAAGILARNAKVDNIGNYAPIGADEFQVSAEHWPKTPTVEPEAGAGVSKYSGRVVLEALQQLDPIARRSVVPTIVWSSLSANTIADHFRELQRFRDYLQGLSETNLDLPVDVLLAHHFQHEWASPNRRTAWTTMTTRLRSIVGAFGMLPVYAPTSIMIRPNKYPIFSAMMTTANRKAVEQPGRQPVPATLLDVKRALEFLPSDRLKWLLITSWFTSSRPTIDTVYVEKRDFVMGDDGKGRVTFRRSKTARKIGAYTIPLNITDPECIQIVQRYFNSVDSDFMIPLPTTGSGDSRIIEPKVESSIRNQLFAAIRKVRPELEIKSFRRGTIARLAELDLETPDILLFTKHTQEKGLKRYLNDEQILHHAQRAARERAAGLGAIVPDRVTGGANVEEEFVDFEDWIRIGSEGSVVTTGRPPCDDVIVRDRSSYPIHCKPETQEGISFEQLEKLPMAERDRVFWKHQKTSWLSDDLGNFSAVERKDSHPSTLTEQQAQSLVRIDNIAEVPSHELHKIKGWIFVFLTPEDEPKFRWRVIKHPEGYNDTHGKDTVDRCGNTTRRLARQAIPFAECAIAVDLAGFFDQLRLPEDVTWFQCFRVGNKVYRNLRVPMGGRHSTQIATAVTRALLSFDHPGVRVDYCTDNVRFCGPRDQVISAAKIFFQRCRLARAKLNEIDVDNFTQADVESLVQYDNSDYVGEVADFRNKTIRCRQKHVDKLLALVTALRGTVTMRQLFAPYAMLLYMSETLGLRLDAHWPARQFYAGLARSLSKDHSLWKSTAGVRPPSDFHQWVSEALANRPATVSCPPPPEVIAIGDACELGYAAIICSKSPDGWSMRLHQRAWSRAEKANMKMHLSTSSEPEAAVRVASHVRKSFPGQRVLYVSDHEPFVNAVSNGCSMRPEYNSRVRKFRNAQMQGEMQFLPGIRNLADKFSRFKTFRLTKKDRLEAVTLIEQALEARDMGTCFVGAREDLPARAFLRG